MQIDFHHTVTYVIARAADLEFELAILNDGASVEMAKMMFTAVDLCGDGFIRTNFSWGFARV